MTTSTQSCDLELVPGENLAVTGDSGAGKPSLIKCLCSACTPATERSSATLAYVTYR